MAKCIDCGMFAWHNNKSTRPLEVPFEWRNVGEALHQTVSAYAVRLLCLAEKETFPRNFPRDPKCSELATKNHECEEFIKWRQGFTPKEHMEMRLSQELVESERKWREAQAEYERRWHGEQATAQRDWQQKQARQQREWRDTDIRRERFDFWFGRVAIPVFSAFLAAVVAFAVTWWQIKIALTP